MRPPSCAAPVEAHRLDRVVWEALSTRQRSMAQGDGLARRYPTAVAPFAATRDDRAPSYRALLGLLAPNDPTAMVTVSEIGDPPGLAVVLRDVVDQMVLDGPALTALSPAPVRLMLGRCGGRPGLTPAGEGLDDDHVPATARARQTDIERLVRQVIVERRRDGEKL